MNDRTNVTMMLTVSINDSEVYNVTVSADVSSYERFITVLQTTVIAVISSGIILSNIVNLIVLASASGAMPWATRLFLINLSISDLLVGVIACAPAVSAAAINTWLYGDAWCQVSGITHGTSVTVSIWSISMIGLHRLDSFDVFLHVAVLIISHWLLEMQIKVNVKISHTRYRALGPELIPVYMQSARM